MSISNSRSLNSTSLIIETIDYYLKHINILYYQRRQRQKIYNVEEMTGNNKDLYVYACLLFRSFLMKNEIVATESVGV